MIDDHTPLLKHPSTQSFLVANSRSVLKPSNQMIDISGTFASFRITEHWKNRLHYVLKTGPGKLHFWSCAQIIQSQYTNAQHRAGHERRKQLKDKRAPVFFWNTLMLNNWVCTTPNARHKLITRVQFNRSIMTSQLLDCTAHTLHFHPTHFSNLDLYLRGLYVGRWGSD